MAKLKENLDFLIKRGVDKDEPSSMAWWASGWHRELEKLKETYIQPPFELKEPVIKDYNWVESMLHKIPNYGSGVRRLGLDMKFYLADEDDMMKIIQWDWINKKPYYRETFDCENFAMAFMSHIAFYFKRNQVALVIDYSGEHGYNLILLPDGRIWIYEPQTDKYWDLAEHNYAAPYVLQQAYILI